MSSNCFVFVTIIAIIVHGASGTLLGLLPLIGSHRCSSLDSQTITGEIIISSAEFTLITAQKVSFASCFTNQVRASHSLNIKVSVEITELVRVNNGDCRVAYRCRGVGHHPTALTCLRGIQNCDEFKGILGRCGRSSGPKIGVGIGGGLLGGLVGGILRPGLSIVGGLLAAITSHSCSSVDSRTISGTFIITSSELELVTVQKTSFASCFTKRVRESHSLNIKITVDVHGIERLNNGDCRVSYRCSNVGHHSSALTCLKATPECDEFKTIIGKCSRSSGSRGNTGSNVDEHIDTDVKEDTGAGGDAQVDEKIDTSVVSHSCSSTDYEAIDGEFILTKLDIELVKGQRDSFVSCFTDRLRESHSLNIDISVEIKEFEQLDNGDCRVSYRCSDVRHHPTALSCLKETPRCDVFRGILGKCSLFRRW